MSFTNTETRYGSVAKAFHWSMALLILTIIPLGLIASGLAERITNPDVPVTPELIARTATLFSLHKTIGVTLFFLALARIAWALTQPHPGLLNADRRAEALAASTVHWLLYGSLVLVPLTGWIHHAATVGYAPIRWPFGQTLPFVPRDETVAALFGGLHVLLEKVLLAALVLHIAGALKHHIIDRDATLRRMLPLGGPAPQPPAQHKSAVPAIAALMIWAAAIGVGAAMGQFSSHHASHANSETPPAASTATAGNWIVREGTLGLSIRQFGSEVAGSFADWSADIRFDDPEGPGPAGQVEVTVSIPSLTLGTLADQAMGPDFFDGDKFPTASFVAEIEKLEDGYAATGPLTIKGMEIPVRLPFTLKANADGSVRMQGIVALDRRDFDIGASMPDESSLAFGVQITVDLIATPAAQS